LAVIC